MFHLPKQKLTQIQALPLPSTPSPMILISQSLKCAPKLQIIPHVRMGNLTAKKTDRCAPLTSHVHLSMGEGLPAVGIKTQTECIAVTE